MTSMACPFCNSLITPTSSQGKTRCPRCGEILPSHFLAAIASSDAGNFQQGFKGGRPAPTTQPGRSNRLLAGIFLLVMGIMAIAALALALLTLQSRKTRDPKLPMIVTRPAEPAELPALSYLPDDCNVVAGILLANLLDTPAGKRLLDSPRPAWLDQGLALVERWTGLQPAAVDHIALGSKLGDEVPQLVAVLRTRAPYRLEELASHFPGKAFPHHRRPLFRFTMQPVGAGFVWCADERTLVLLLRPDFVKIEDMDRVPAQPRPEAEALTGSLRALVKEYFRNADAWLAGSLPRKEPWTSLLKLFPVAGQQSPPLAQARDFGVSLRADDDLTAIGFVQVRDAGGLQPWRRFLDDLPIPAGSRRIYADAGRGRVDFQFRWPASAGNVTKGP